MSVRIFVGFRFGARDYRVAFKSGDAHIRFQRCQTKGFLVGSCCRFRFVEILRCAQNDNQKCHSEEPFATLEGRLPRRRMWFRSSRRGPGSKLIRRRNTEFGPRPQFILSEVEGPGRRLLCLLVRSPDDMLSWPVEMFSCGNIQQSEIVLAALRMTKQTVILWSVRRRIWFGSSRRRPGSKLIRRRNTELGPYAGATTVGFFAALRMTKQTVILRSVATKNLLLAMH